MVLVSELAVRLRSERAVSELAAALGSERAVPSLEFLAVHVVMLRSELIVSPWCRSRGPSSRHCTLWR